MIVCADCLHKFAGEDQFFHWYNAQNIILLLIYKNIYIFLSNNKDTERKREKERDTQRQSDIDR